MATVAQLFGSVTQRFRPEKAAGVALIFHFDIAGNTGGQYTIAIQNGACQVTVGLIGTADCLIATDAATYVGLETGSINPQEALMQGKVQVSNIMHMLNFAKLFKKFEEEQPKITSRGKRHLPAGPLTGIRVVDFSRLLPGPLATLFMAQMGAEVIKVEDKHSPDYIRSFPPFINGQSAYYLGLNTGKYSVCLNFNDDKARLLELIKTADILVEQYRPGVMDSMGFGYQTIKQLNPRIIYCSITGYGQTGAMAQLAGHDLNYLAQSGLLGLNVDETGKPVIPAFQLADVSGGSHTALTACLAALFERERTGQGKYLDVAMAKSVTPLLALPLASQQATGHTIKELAGHIANYNIYKCADGKYIALGALEAKFWSGFCQAIDKPDWQARIANMEDNAVQALKNDLEGIFATHPSAYWQQIGAKHDICISIVKQLGDLTTDAFMVESNALATFNFEGKDIAGVQFPVQFNQGAAALPHAPYLGEDNELFT